MASYTAARSVHKTLAANRQDVVTLTDTASTVEIINRGVTDAIYGRVGSPAADVPDVNVAGDDTFALPPGGVRTITVAQQDLDLVVKLIAFSPVPYSVQTGGQ